MQQNNIRLLNKISWVSFVFGMNAQRLIKRDHEVAGEVRIRSVGVIFDTYSMF
jgi:hypothetical protein